MLSNEPRLLEVLRIAQPPEPGGNVLENPLVEGALDGEIEAVEIVQPVDTEEFQKIDSHAFDGLQARGVGGSQARTRTPRRHRRLRPSARGACRPR